MVKIKLSGITPQELKKEIVEDLKNSLLPELTKSLKAAEPVELLTRKETAALLKIDVGTLANYTKNKLLKSYGISGRVYYKRHEVEAAIIELKH